MYNRTPQTARFDTLTPPSGSERRSSPSPVLPLPAFSTGTTATSSTSTVQSYPLSDASQRTRELESHAMIRGDGRTGYSSGSGSGTGNKTAGGISYDRIKREDSRAVNQLQVAPGIKVSTVNRSRTITGYSSETVTPAGKHTDLYPARGRRTPTPPLIDFVNPVSPPGPSEPRLKEHGRARDSFSRSSPDPHALRSRSPSPTPQHQALHIPTSRPQPSTDQASRNSTPPPPTQTKLQELLARMQKPIPRPDISPSRFRTNGVGNTIAGSEVGTRADASQGAGVTGLRARRSQANLRSRSEDGRPGGDRSHQKESNEKPGLEARTPRQTTRPPTPQSTYSRLPIRTQPTPTSRTPRYSTQNQTPQHHESEQPPNGSLSPIQGRGIWRDGRSKHGFPPPSPRGGALRAVTPEGDLPVYMRRRAVEGVGEEGHEQDEDYNGGYQGDPEEEEGGYEEEPAEDYRIPAPPVNHNLTVDTPSKADATLGSAERRSRRGDQQEQATPVRGGVLGRRRELLVDLGSANGASSSSGVGAEETGEYSDREGRHDAQDESDSDSYLLRQRRIGVSQRTIRPTQGVPGRRESVRPIMAEEEDSPPPRVRIRPKRRSDEAALSPEGNDEREEQRRSPNLQLLQYLAAHPEPPSVLDEPIARTTMSVSRIQDELPSQAPSTIRGKKKWVSSSPQVVGRSQREDSRTDPAHIDRSDNPTMKATLQCLGPKRSAHALAGPGAVWASPSMDSFARGIEERAERTGHSVDFETSEINGADLEDQRSEVDDEEQIDQPGPTRRLENRVEARAGVPLDRRESLVTPIRNRSQSSRLDLTPQPLTPDPSPTPPERKAGLSDRSLARKTATASPSSQAHLAEESPYRAVRTSPLSRSATSYRLENDSRQKENSRSLSSRDFRPLSVRQEADLPDLPVPEDVTLEHDVAVPQQPSRSNVRPVSPPVSPPRLVPPVRTPSKAGRTADVTARTPHPPGAWASGVAEERKVHFSPSRESEPTEMAKDRPAAHKSPVKQARPRDRLPVQEDDRPDERDPVSLGPPSERGAARRGNDQGEWRDALHQLKREVGRLAVEKPLPETPSVDPDMEGEDPTFSSSLAEIEARLADLGDREEEWRARDKVEAATKDLRNGIAALGRWSGGVAQEGTALQPERKTGWLPYLGKRAFYAWAIFRLVVALNEREVNRLDPFLYVTPHQSFLHAATVYDTIRNVVYAANTSSEVLSALLTNTGVLEVFLRNDGMIPRRLPV